MNSTVSRALRTIPRRRKRNRSPLHAPLRWIGAIALASLAMGVISSAPSCRAGRGPGDFVAQQASPLPPIPRRHPELRIRIARFVDSARIDGPATVRISHTDADEAISLPAPVEITRSRTAFLVRAGDDPPLRFRGAAPVRIQPGAESALSLDGAPYPGEFILLPASPESLRFDIIEETGLETYLPGVLAKELYAGWSEATFEAQAIAARSYAMHERRRSRAEGRPFDLESTTRDQAYAGAGGGRKAARAVQKTAGRVLLDEKGDLLRSYYSSTCGGRAASAADTWPTTAGFEYNLAPPIQAHPRECGCEISSVHRWTVERSKRELIARFRAFGATEHLAVRTIESIKGITPQRSNSVGRPADYRVFDQEGRWWALSAEQLRRALNYPAAGFQAVTSKTRARSGDVEVKMTAENATVLGRGFGHGVGLCQFGAEAMARKSARATDIVLHYYPGARVERLY